MANEFSTSVVAPEILCAEAKSRGGTAIGLDFSATMLERSLARLPMSSFIRADAQCLPLKSSSVDHVVSGFALRNFSSVDQAISETARVLRTGGKFALLEVDRPSSNLLRKLFDFHFTKIVPMIGARFSDGYAYKYLSESLVYLPSKEELENILRMHGFENVHKRQFLAGSAQLVVSEKMRSR